MACGSVDLLFLDFSMTDYITVLLHFLIHQASVLSAVECLMCATLKAHYIFLLIIILLISRSVVQVNVPDVCFFLLYSGGLQFICSGDIIIAEYLSIATGCDHHRNTRLDLLFAP